MYFLLNLIEIETNKNIFRTKKKAYEYIQK